MPNFDIPDDVMLNALQKGIDVLIAKHRQLGMEATGQWIESLEAVAYTNSGVIRGAHYTEQLVFGRDPGKRPPIEPLEQWVEAKFGISGRQARSAAFAVATKIAQSGTTWYQKGGSDLLEVLEDPEFTNSVYTEIGTYLTVAVTEELTREINRL